MSKEGNGGGVSGLKRIEKWKNKKRNKDFEKYF